MSTTDGLVIPVSTPGADKAAEDLGRVAAATVQVGQGAQEMGASVARGGTASTQALAAIGASAARSESHLADLKVTGNQALQELGQKGAEFARSIGGAGGAVAELGVKILATAGPYGAMAAAGVGAIGMIVGAIHEHQAALALDVARTGELTQSTSILGGSYASVTTAINSAKTAQEAHTAAVAETLDVLRQQITLQQQGYSPEASQRLTETIGRLGATEREVRGTFHGANEELIRHALLSGNAAEQMSILGFSFRHSTDAAQEQINVTNASNVALSRAADATARHKIELNTAAVARRRAAQAAVEGLTDEAAASAAGDRATRELREAEEAAMATYRNMNVATAEAARLRGVAAHATRDLTSSTKDFENASKEAGRAAHVATVAEAARTAARAAAAAGPSAQEQRAAVEALRVAREANENAGRTITFSEQQAQALRAVAHATHEVALAERALHTGSATVAERTALTRALSGQTTAQTTLVASVEAETTALRAKRTALIEESDARETLELRAQQSLREGMEIARVAAERERQAVIDRQDALSTAGAAREAAGVSTKEAERLQLILDQALSIRHLSDAQRRLTEVQNEYNHATTITLALQGRMTSAINEVAAAQGHATAATRAANAETDKIKSDRMDDLAESFGGLAKAQISSAYAAALAGENAGVAAQKALKASLAALSQESAIKALYATATGLFQVATGNPAGVQTLISAGMFAGVAAAAGVGAAIIPDVAAAPPAGGGGGGGRAASVSSSSSGTGETSTTSNTTINYYAPVFGGREGGIGEVGQQIDRYRRDNTALRRTRP